jgi:hypothetical protein|tara:strand:- start:642 stop:827 length:186 start_codon:yes stop_codon:yes gene_type:complete
LSEREKIEKRLQEMEKKGAKLGLTLGPVPSVPKLEVVKPIVEEKEPEKIVTPKEEPKISIE